MPSLAFAADCNYPDANTWDKLQEVLKTDDAKYVKEYVAPTWHTAGSATLICKEDWCGETKKVNFPALCNGKSSKQEFWVEDLAAKYLEQGVFKNELAAKKWADSMKAKGYCRFKDIFVHDDCGKVETPLTTASTVASKKVGHKKPDGTKDCQDYNCGTCGELIKAAKTHKFTKPADMTTIADKKVSDPNCGKGTGYEVECEDCEKSFVWYDDDVNSNAHSYGTPVSVSEATTRSTSGGYNVKAGYLAVKYDDTAVDGAVDKDEVNDYVFYKATELVDVDPSDVTCAGNSYGVKCTVCGHVNPKTTEGVCDYEKTHVDATCDHAGYNKLVCKNCGSIGKDEDLSKTEPKLAHSYKVTKTDATCTSGEVYTIECTTCEEDCAKKKEEVKSAGTLDVYEKNTDSTTVLWRGFDDELSTKNAIALTFTNNTSKAHKYGATELIKAADCENDEIWGKKCTVCGKVNHALATVKPNTKLGHDYAEVKTAATCGAFGTISKTCTRCNDTVDTVKDTTAKPVVALGTKCSFDKWVVTKKPTVFEKGVEALVCSVCGADGHENEAIDKLSVAKASNTVKAGKKSFNVKSSAANATGYRVYYKKAGAKSWKSYTKKTTSLSKTFSGLSKGKYYVKVKAYAKNYAGDGEVVWGATSSTKTVNVK